MSHHREFAVTWPSRVVGKRGPEGHVDILRIAIPQFNYGANPIWLSRLKNIFIDKSVLDYTNYDGTKEKSIFNLRTQ